MEFSAQKKGPAAIGGGALVSKAGRWGRGAEGARHHDNRGPEFRFRDPDNYFR